MTDSRIVTRRKKRFCKIIERDVNVASEWEVYYDPLVEKEIEKPVVAEYCENRALCTDRGICCIHTRGTAGSAPDPFE